MFGKPHFFAGKFDPDLGQFTLDCVLCIFCALDSHLIIVLQLFDLPVVDLQSPSCCGSCSLNLLDGLRRLFFLQFFSHRGNGPLNS